MFLRELFQKEQNPKEIMSWYILGLANRSLFQNTVNKVDLTISGICLQLVLRETSQK